MFGDCGKELAVVFVKLECHLDSFFLFDFRFWFLEGSFLCAVRLRLCLFAHARTVCSAFVGTGVVPFNHSCVDDRRETLEFSLRRRKPRRPLSISICKIIHMLVGFFQGTLDCLGLIVSVLLLGKLDNDHKSSVFRPPDPFPASVFFLERFLRGLG